MPSGIHWPDLSQTLRDGPSNSKPLSHWYVATVPMVYVSLEKNTVEWAGDPGNLHTSDKSAIKMFENDEYEYNR